MNGFGLTVMPAFTCLDSLCDNVLARLQPFVNDPLRAHALADFNRSDANLVIVADYRHLVATLQLRHRALGNKQSAFLRRCDRPNAGELAGTKDISRIREQSLQP